MAHQTFFYWLNNSIPSSIRIVALADMGCLICLLNIGTLKMVLRFLPDGEIPLLNNLLPDINVNTGEAPHKSSYYAMLINVKQENG